MSRYVTFFSLWVAENGCTFRPGGTQLTCTASSKRQHCTHMFVVKSG